MSLLGLAVIVLLYVLFPDLMKGVFIGLLVFAGIGLVGYILIVAGAVVLPFALLSGIVYVITTQWK